MLVNTKNMLADAVKKQYAVGHFNIINLEWAKAIIEVHQEKGVPVILGVSEGAAEYMGGCNVVSNMITGLIDDLKISIPIALMLDHGSYETCLDALAAGFSAIMFDGSKYPLKTYLKLISELVKCSHAKGATVEAEVGKVGGEKDGMVYDGEIATKKECMYLTETGVDIIAAGFGNMHGEYPDNWKGLNFNALDEIKSITGNIPLSLHGGSGIPKDQIKRAITLGVAKVNFGTELQMIFAKMTREYFDQGKDLEKKGYDPRKLLKPGVDGIKKSVDEKLQLLGVTNIIEGMSEHG